MAGGHERAAWALISQKAQVSGLNKHLGCSTLLLFCVGEICGMLLMAENFQQVQEGVNNTRLSSSPKTAAKRINAYEF